LFFKKHHVLIADLKKHNKLIYLPNLLSTLISPCKVEEFFTNPK
jgi:hypothetical protein